MNAVGLEDSFALLLRLPLGRRAKVNDADVFRNGDPASLSKLLKATADSLEKRLPVFGKPKRGSPAARIQVGISDIRDAAALLKKNRGIDPRRRDTPRAVERQTYQWIVIGGLVVVLAAVLDHVTAPAGR